jgi:hypothetical protein
MYPLNETPSPVVLFALVVVIAGVAAFLFRRARQQSVKGG